MGDAVDGASAYVGRIHEELRSRAIGRGVFGDPGRHADSSPVDSKCQAYGLKGCPQLVEGAIAYAQGDKAGGLEHIEHARALNTPQQLEQFASALAP